MLGLLAAITVVACELTEFPVINVIIWPRIKMQIWLSQLLSNLWSGLTLWSIVLKKIDFGFEEYTVPTAVCNSVK